MTLQPNFRIPIPSRRQVAAGLAATAFAAGATGGIRVGAVAQGGTPPAGSMTVEAFRYVETGQKVGNVVITVA